MHLGFFSFFSIKLWLMIFFSSLFFCIKVFGEGRLYVEMWGEFKYFFIFYFFSTQAYK